MAKRYSTEKVQQILVQAMGQSQREGFSRSQLEEMANDLGISSDGEIQTSMPVKTCRRHS